MKNWCAAFFGTFAIVCAGNAFAHHGGGGGGSYSAALAPHSGSTATLAPHFSGMAPFSGVNAYRPVVTYHGNTRTLNYPPVGNSVLHQPNHSNMVGLNSSGHVLQHSGLVRQSSHSNAMGNHPLDPQTSTRLRNWNGNRSSAEQAHLNNFNNFQHHHDHDWWRHHCFAFVLFDFGWWGWWDGWWYPAWGYDPYSYYEYNQPIYGYNGQSPEQIVASVQAALQQQGYYQYAVDGQMGPLTRSAISLYQRDHRLPITYGIDPATLGSLGIIR
jgi:Putative peptidoglycan binding domain